MQSLKNKYKPHKKNSKKNKKKLNQKNFLNEFLTYTVKKKISYVDGFNVKIRSF